MNAVVFAHSYNDDVQERKETMSSFYFFVSIQGFVVFTSCGENLRQLVSYVTSSKLLLMLTNIYCQFTKHRDNLCAV